ncbi:hypothetical protein BN2537_1141 [Streptomyces venezuelae]|nr:hypothetical protein BN2537_1141 [Streptomyces venezuelae]
MPDRGGPQRGRDLPPHGRLADARAPADEEYFRMFHGR